MKKSILIILLTLSFVFVPVNVFAESKTRVYSDVNTYTEDTVEIPIKIENNNGLMGFKFNIKSNNLSISEVSIGEAFSGGMFNSKISDKKDSADIVWTNSENVNANGEMFSIKAKVLHTDSPCDIDLVYSPSDTIDANYNEVDLLCDKITISPQQNIPQSTTSNTSFENQKDEELILQYLNILDNDTAKKIVVSSLSETSSKVDKKKNYSTGEIKSIINELSNEDKELFVKRFNQNISNQYPDLPGIPNDNGSALIAEILDCTNEYTIKSITQPVITESDAIDHTETIDEAATQDEYGSAYIIPIVIIATIVLIAIIIIIFIKRRRMKNEV